MAGLAVAVAFAGCAPSQPAPPPPAQPATAQALTNTLERLRQQQNPARKAHQAQLEQYPDATPRLTADENRAMQAQLAACATRTPSLPTEPGVDLTVVFDAEGVVRIVSRQPPGSEVNLAPAERVQYERAVRALYNSSCSKLPLPASVLGRPGRINFRFKP